MMKRYLKESGVLTIGSFTQKIITIVLLALLSRLFGPVGIGQWTLSLVTITWFSQFSTLGLEVALTRFIAKTHSERLNFYPKFKKISSIILTVSLLASMVHFALSDFLANIVYHDSSMVLYLQIASPLIFLGNLYVLMYFSFRGFRQFGKMVLMDNLKQAVYFILTFAIIYFTGFGVESVLIGSVLSTLLIIIFFLKPLISHISLFKSFKKVFTESLYSFSVANFLIVVLSVISVNLDKFFLGVFLSPSDVGVYFSAFTFLSVLNIFSVSLSNTVLPASAQLKTKKKKEYFLNNSIRYSLLVYLVFSSIIGLFPESLPLVFGEEFMTAMPLAFPLFMMGVFQLVYSILNKYHIGIGKVNKIPVIYFIGLITNSIVMFYLINMFGAFGAALSQIIYYSVLFALFIVVLKSKIGKENYVIMFVNLLLLTVLRELYKINYLNRLLISLIIIIIVIITLFFFVEKREKEFAVKKIKEFF